MTSITILPNGIADTTENPPQNALAVGTSYVVSAEGGQISWSGLTGAGRRRKA